MSHEIDTVWPSLLVPASKTAHLSALIELKSGVGGSESSLFVADLLKMYTRFANLVNWQTQLVSHNEIGGGAVKDAILEVKGRGSYDNLKWETGVHRVQRVPATEASGRVHTSTVAVLVTNSHNPRTQPLVHLLTRLCPCPRTRISNETTSCFLWKTSKLRSCALVVLEARQVISCDAPTQICQLRLACEHNRISGPTDSRTDGCHSVNAG